MARRPPLHPSDLRAGRIMLVAGFLMLGLFLGHVAQLDVVLGLGAGEVEGEAQLAEQSVTLHHRSAFLRQRQFLIVSLPNGRRRWFGMFRPGFWTRLITAAEARGAVASTTPLSRGQLWKVPQPVTASGDRPGMGPRKRLVFRVRYAGLGRKVVTGFEAL